MTGYLLLKFMFDCKMACSNWGGPLAIMRTKRPLCLFVRPCACFFCALAEARAEGLAKLEDWCGCLAQVNDAAEKDGSAKSMLKKCLWPSMEWYMELLWELAEAGFETVPAHVEQELRGAGRALQSTKLVEYGHHILRSVERRGNSGHTSRASRWNALKASALLGVVATAGGHAVLLA